MKHSLKTVGHSCGTPSNDTHLRDRCKRILLDSLVKPFGKTDFSITLATLQDIAPATYHDIPNLAKLHPVLSLPGELTVMLVRRLCEIIPHIILCGAKVGQTLWKQKNICGFLAFLLCTGPLLLLLLLILLLPFGSSASTLSHTCSEQSLRILMWNASYVQKQSSYT